MDLEALIQRAAQENGLDPEQLRALIGIESGGDPNALSPKGAMGMMQLMPGTAREMGVTDPNDPEQNIMGGAKYFRQQVDRFGDPDLAAAAYNAGPAAVQKYGGVPPYRETQDYVGKFRDRLSSAGMAPRAGAQMDTYGDPTANAMAMLPQVSRSAVDENTIRSTLSVADKLTSGQLTGSLTAPSDREANSTGSLAADMIPTWQTALKILNPVNLLQLPVRALRMVDYTLRNAAGQQTLSDGAEQSLAYINTGETIARDPRATARDARLQELGTARGLRSQILNPTQKLVHIFTQDPFEGERKAISAGQRLRAQWSAQSDLDKVMQARNERDVGFAKAPWDVAKAKAEAEAAEARAPYAGPTAAANLRNAQGIPGYRENSLIAQGLGYQRSVANDRNQQNRQTFEDVRWAEDKARQARERQEDIADRRAAGANVETRAMRDDTRQALALAEKAETVEEANNFLRDTPFMAVKNNKWWIQGGRHFDLVPRGGADPAGAAPAAAAPTPTPAAAAGGIDGMRGEIAAQVRAKFEAKLGRAPTQKELDEGVAYELNRRSSAR